MSQDLIGRPFSEPFRSISKHALDLKEEKEDWSQRKTSLSSNQPVGFNNDWDLTSGLLLYLLSISGFPPSPKKKKILFHQ